nr:MAG TPA: hypothetical protein [Caudoviricetes sp.]DAU86340.1 MAG TPA: hypothetical protein [Caudoviricetes sp.]
MIHKGHSRCHRLCPFSYAQWLYKPSPTPLM